MSASNKQWLWALIILAALAVIFVGSFWDKSWNERLEELVSSHQQFEDDDDSDYDLNDAMRHLGLMANLRGYMAGGKEGFLIVDVLII